MLVKNPTGNTINYLFANLVLTPGESKEIDNSYIENLEFQEALYNNTISVLKYEKDFVSNTVVISMGVPPTSPSIDQKGGLVAANQLSCLNPVMTHKDYLIDNVHLDYATDTSITLKGSFLNINGKLVYIDSIIYNTLTDFKIDQNGNNMGVPFDTNTIGYLYVNKEKLLRPSVYPPSIIEYYYDKYLINDWKYVGMFKLNSLGKLDNILHVYSYYRKEPKYLYINNLTGTINATSPNTLESIYGTTILSNGGIKIKAGFNIATSNSSESIEYAINDKLFASTLGGGYMSGFYFLNNFTVDETNIVFSMSGSTTEHSCNLATFDALIEVLQ